MKWFKSTLTRQQSNRLQANFGKIFLTLNRPQKAFLYEKDEPISNNGQVLYEVYFTPDCKISMPELLKEFSATECEKPKRNDVTGLCTVQDFEEMIWAN